jgi:hypothetical protein
MAIKFLNAINVDSGVLYTDVVNNRVGIGTTSPDNKLSVAGNIQATNNGVDISDNSDWPTNIIIGNSVYPAYIKAHRYTGSYSNGLDFYYSDASSGNSTLGIRLNSNGNVGIGTTSPAQKLSVAGTFSTSGDATFNGTNTYINSSYIYVGNNATDIVGISGNTMYFPGTGNVGIGTTSPGGKLQITSPDVGSVRSYTTSNGFGLIFDQYYSAAAEPGASYTRTADIVASTGDVSSSQIRFLTKPASSNPAVAMLISGNGNVGIGTTSPFAKLEVNSAITFSSVDTFGQLVVKSASGSTGDMLNIGVDTTNSVAFIQAVERGINTIPLSLQRYGGNVGIGTASPDRQLTVGDGVNSSINVKTAFNAPVWEVEGMGTSNLEGYQGMFYQNTKTVQIRANGDSYFNGGNIGIGTTSPGEKLQVQGNIIVNKDSTAANFVSKTFTTGHAAANRGGSILFGMNDSTPTGMKITTSVATNASYNKQEIEFITHEGAVSVGTRMKIDSVGNVGIGTISPATALDVNGTISVGGSPIASFSGNYNRISRPNGTVGIYLGNANDAGNYYDNTNHYFRSSGGSSTYAVINYLGNVGIGTTSPSAKLEVSADVAKGILINRTYTTSSQTLSNVRAYYGLAITPLRGGAGGLYFTNYDADTPIIQSVNSSDVAQSLLLNPLGGNVGIGTTSPATKLEIHGNNSARNTLQNILTINGGTNSNNVYSGFGMGLNFNGRDYSNQPRDYAYIYGVQEASSTSTPGGDPGFTSQLTFYTNTGGAVNTLPTQKMVITAAGNVGIGTASPNALLEVDNQTYSNTKAIANFVNGNNPVRVVYDTVVVAQTDVPCLSLVETPSGAQATEQKLTFAVGDNSAVIRSTSTVTNGIYINVAAVNSDPGYLTTSGLNAIRVLNNGNSIFNYNVGIGTTSPSSPFTVATDVRAASLTATDLRPQSQLNLLGGGGDSLFIGQLTNSTVYMQSSYFNATLATYPMSLNPLGGNVGIGTTSPRTKTEFASGLPTSIPTYSNTTNGIVVTDGGDIYGRIGVSNFSASSAGYPTYIQAGDWSGATYYNLLLNPNGGNVGIGTTGPTYKLDVSGTGRFTSTVTATNFILSSDERKKTKIKDLSRDNIDISWKSFEMKSDEGEYRVGVIAQELEIKHPEFVNTDNEGFKSVKYIDLLISKIAELEARLEKAGI